ncbi:MOB kinase activator 2 [Galemys pyrenaicus]|uniref:MOB kinase activator 2 n=1 Tax=Galemys pyrenaicus TaxID=202257 RepID=A0A8J5Z855_GALPY|nr:MOB kinase activator 2 [Galemys pyrenaicus]
MSPSPWNRLVWPRTPHGPGLPALSTGSARAAGPVLAAAASRPLAWEWQEGPSAWEKCVCPGPPRAGPAARLLLTCPADRLPRRKSKAKPNGKKPAAEEKKLYLEPEYTKSRISDFEFKELVVLPREIDLNEWLASNTTTFFHHVNLQYSTVSEFCTGEACQTMAVGNTQYYWYDERGKKVKCTAPQYVDFVMSSVQKLVTDEDVFPTKYGREFPSSFEALVKRICRHLFHVLAHIYSAHFKETLALELHPHLNTLYVHFILFAREFSLLDPKETAVMDDLTQALCRGGAGAGTGGGAGAQNHVKER